MNIHVVCASVGMAGGLIREILSDRETRLPHIVKTLDGSKILWGDIIPSLLAGGIAGLTAGMATTNPVLVFLSSVGAIDVAHNGVKKAKN